MDEIKKTNVVWTRGPIYPKCPLCGFRPESRAMRPRFEQSSKASDTLTVVRAKCQKCGAILKWTEPIE